MKMLLAGIVLIFIAGSEAHWYNFPGEAVQGAGDMWRAYQDMKQAGWKNGDKYFHARGNYEAAQRGPGGVWVAEVISDLRELVQGSSGQGPEDEAADQAANRWGRSGGDPNHYRPNGLPEKY